MARLYCVDLGFREAPNLVRMATSIFVAAENAAAAIQYVEDRFSAVLLRASIQRVVEAEGLIMNWTSGELELVRDSEQTQFEGNPNTQPWD
ncbi:MAG: hypothetical protein ROO76_20755 [Terriglobia bacterium]|nr:hypothetical protein [Terriglobia bacterium]